MDRGGRVPGEEGIWVFILGDMCVFALFFGVFVYERGAQVAVFDASARTLNTTTGLVNTLLLVTSSLFVALAVRAVREGRSGRARRLLAGALLCGLGFVFDKFLEYGDKLSAGLKPATNDFYMYFYAFTGIHLLHLVIGMVVLAFVWRAAGADGASQEQIRFTEAGASYWHLVDLLWIVLFALFYLMA